MREETVLKNLSKLHDCKETFTVTFSGKKSKKLNGFYNPNTHIHNRNFGNDKAGENLLFYTAMHELAHHIQYTEHGQKSAKAHTRLFYAILDDLAEIAEKKKLYKVNISKDTQKLIDEAKSISFEIARLQRKLGKIVIAIMEKCEEEGIRFEDVTARKAQLSLQTVKNSQLAYHLDLPKDIGMDIQAAAISEQNEDNREKIINAAKNGKSINQSKQVIAPPVPEDETYFLTKEKMRIERTIQTLMRRLDEIEKQLKEEAA